MILDIVIMLGTNIGTDYRYIQYSLLTISERKKGIQFTGVIMPAPPPSLSGPVFLHRRSNLGKITDAFY